MADVKITTTDRSQVIIEGLIPATQFAAERAATLAEFNQTTKLAGFRAGHIPETVLEREVGNGRILEAMAERALQTEYPKILAEHKIDAIGQPQITLTKLALGEDLGFKIVTDVIPLMALPDWQTIIQKIGDTRETAVVTAEEVNKVVAELLASRIKPGEEPPALTDELAAQFGEFKTAQDLTEQIKKNLTAEKEKQAEDKWRLRLIEEIIAKTNLIVPATLIEAETDKMLAELRDSLERVGMKFDDYLTHLKKTEADLRAAWQADAEKRVKVGLTMNEIAKAEKLEPEPEQVKKEAEHLKSHYPDVAEDRIAAYVAHILTMEKVWERLEAVAKKL